MMELFDIDKIIYRLKHTANNGQIILSSIFGKGFAYYSMQVRTLDRFALVDSEYQKHLAELGIVGFFILFSIIRKTLSRCMKINGNHLPKVIFLFYLLAAIGASVLSNESQYPFIFWFSIGLLWNNKILKRYG